MESGIYFEQLLPRGFVKPEDEAPLIMGLDFYIDAFRELGTSRPSGMGVAPIPFTAIVEYSRIYETGDLDEFVYLIRMMDDAFLRWHLNKSKSAVKATDEHVKKPGGDVGGTTNTDAKNNNRS